MRAPSEDLMDVLANASDVALTVGVDLHGNKMPAAPDQCVSINDSGGYAPDVNVRILHPTAQALIRGDKGDYREAYALAATIRDVIVPPGRDGLPAPCSFVLGGARYIGIWVQSDVFFLGRDELDRPLFSVNFRMDRTEEIES